MSETETDLDARLDAVERALTDDGTDLADVRDAAALSTTVDDIENRVAQLEATVEELDAAVQAVRGYAGNVRAVNREVERRASAALAKAEALESSLADRRAGDRTVVDATPGRDSGTTRSAEDRSAETDTRGDGRSVGGKRREDCRPPGRDRRRDGGPTDRTEPLSSRSRGGPAPDRAASDRRSCEHTREHDRRCSGAEARDPGVGTRGPEVVARGPEVGARGPEVGTRDPEASRTQRAERQRPRREDGEPDERQPSRRSGDRSSPAESTGRASHAVDGPTAMDGAAGPGDPVATDDHVRMDDDSAGEDDDSGTEQFIERVRDAL